MTPGEGHEDRWTSTLGNYYEGNWNEEIESACNEAIRANMRATGTRSDPDASVDMIRTAAGDECDEAEGEG